MLQFSLTRKSEKIAGKSGDLEFVLLNKKSSDHTGSKPKSSTLVSIEKPKKEKEETINSLSNKIKDAKLQRETLRNALSIPGYSVDQVNAMNAESEKK